MERGSEGVVIANLTSELAASSSQNSLPGGSGESQPVVCGDLGPLLAASSSKNSLPGGSSVSQPSCSQNSLQGSSGGSQEVSRACGLPDGSSRNSLPGSSPLISLREQDIPGASLNGREPNQLHVVELKRWLKCRGATTGGKKQDLVKRLVLS